MSDDSTFLWVRDWKPQSFFTAEAVEASLGDRLRAMVGLRLDEVWVAWDLGADEWFCDAPVLLVVGGQQIEVSVFQLNELCISFNAIDRSAPFGWDDADFDLKWRRNPSIVPHSLLGRPVAGFGATEYAFELADFVGTLPWVLISLEFKLEGAHLAIENGLDENALRFQPLEETDEYHVKWFGGERPRTATCSD